MGTNFKTRIAGAVRTGMAAAFIGMAGTAGIAGLHPAGQPQRRHRRHGHLP